MPKPTKLSQGTQDPKSWLVATMLSALVATSPIALAGEGGTSHIMPGANATMVDLPPTSPGGFFKPMYINYQGSASARVPTAAGIVANLNADANTLVLGGGYGLEQTVLGGAHYSGRRVPALHLALHLRETRRRWAASRSRTACPASAT